MGEPIVFSTKGTVAKSAILGAGPYEIENVRVISKGYYTNNTPSRGNENVRNLTADLCNRINDGYLL